MSERFEDLSRIMAGPSTRRGALKMMGAALGAAAVATVVKPFRGYASTGDSVVCSGSTTAGHIPCAAGTTPCNQCCCKKGIACVNAATSACGCRAGTTPCGKACCKAGVACASKATSTCSGTGNAVACTGAGKVCGSTCCTATECCNGGTCGSCSVCTIGGDACGDARNLVLCGNRCWCLTKVDGGFYCSNMIGPVCAVCVTDADCVGVTGPGSACIQGFTVSGCCSPPTICMRPCPSGT